MNLTRFIYYILVLKLKWLYLYHLLKTSFLIIFLILTLSRSFSVRLFFFNKINKYINYFKILTKFYELFNIKVLLSITAIYVYFFLFFLFFISISYNLVNETLARSSFLYLLEKCETKEISGDTGFFYFFETYIINENLVQLLSFYLFDDTYQTQTNKTILTATSFKLYFSFILIFIYMLNLIHIILGLLGLFYDYLLKKFSKDNQIFLGFIWYGVIDLVLNVGLIILFLIIIF